MAALQGLPVLLLAAGCVVVPDPGAVPPDADGLIPPAGFGTLRQDDVTVGFSSGDLQIRVTPLAESVIRTTAPDTERRLRGVSESLRADVLAGAGPDASMFLVSFFSLNSDATFRPDELQLLTRSVRVRPDAVLPVTPGWGQHRVRQRETEVAVYVFSPTVDLESELAVVYGLEESWAWRGILVRVQAERARARARSRAPGAR